jgi:hypothetical protein
MSTDILAGIMIKAELRMRIIGDFYIPTFLVFNLK